MTEVSVGAIDLGAESGRVAKVAFGGEKVELEVVSRFNHRVSHHENRLAWDWSRIVRGVEEGLSNLGSLAHPASVGVDAWGLDYGYLGSDAALLAPPLCYRDPVRQDAFGELLATLGSEFLYQQSGTQIVPINGVFDMWADIKSRPDLLHAADQFLMIPDLVHQMLAGVAVAEYTVATTSGIFDISTGGWSTAIAEAMGFEPRLFPPIVQPGEDLGYLVPQLRSGGLMGTKVIVPASHDTASAVLAIPGLHAGEMFISSGTWSLVGALLPEPVITEISREKNFTNEGGLGGSVRFLRNVMGLWMLQESRRWWQSQGQDYDYPSLVELGQSEDPCRSILNPGDTRFINPGDMPRQIREYCHENFELIPETPGQVVRTIVDSNALAYRECVEDLEAVTGKKIERIRVVGGGVQNALLQQATADATGLEVVCGAVEATALGNGMVQLMALGEIDSVESGWGVIRQSVKETVFLPTNTDPYLEAYDKYQALKSKADFK